MFAMSSVTEISYYMFHNDNKGADIMTLYEARIRLGLTHKQISQMLDINENSYLRYEHYKVKPIVTMAIRISHILRCDVEELFDISNYEGKNAS